MKTRYLNIQYVEFGPYENYLEIHGRTLNFIFLKLKPWMRRKTEFLPLRAFVNCCSCSELKETQVGDYDDISKRWLKYTSMLVVLAVGEF